MSAALWYLARGSGVVALLLLTVVVLLGIVVRSGRPLPGLPRFAVAAVHRSAGLLSVLFVVAHVVTLLVDPYAQLHLVDLLVPFVSTYRPLWVGLGTVGLDLLLAVTATSLLRQRIGRRVWRAVHFSAYAAWPVALVHGLGSGTDAATMWLRLLDFLCVALVAVAIGWRLSAGFAERERPISRAMPVSGMDGRS